MVPPVVNIGPVDYAPKHALQILEREWVGRVKREDERGSVQIAGKAAFANNQAHAVGDFV